jgi:hypothetical protein
MDKREFFERLVGATTTVDALAAVSGFRASHKDTLEEKPLGYRLNNRGTVEVATDPGRSAIERITNAIDALLELEHSTHNGKPACSSPRLAAQAWLGIDHSGLSATTQKQRQLLARRTVVTLESGENKSSRILSVRDTGIGLFPERMSTTILSLNESNKWQKHYLAGTFGQGGSSTFAFSKISLIASRRYRSNTIGFTVVWYKDLPADQYKSGHYVYLTDAKSDVPFSIDFKEGDPLAPHGTLVRHFGYDLTNYPSPFGERSLYGAMNRLLFDPVAPIWFENKVDGWNRGIYGSRTRLNSGSDESEGDNKLQLEHRMPMTSVSLGELGQVGFEYWLLPIPERKNSIPTAAYVDHHKPIVLSVNGQNQSELSALLIRKEAELPYLRNRLICHIDCDGLSSLAKRALFSSTREQAKEGEILERIRQELIDLLRSDDDLKRLNREAKEKTLADTDEETKKRVRKEVARMLTLMGKSQAETLSTSSEGSEQVPRGKGGGYRKLEPLETREPPTFIRILHDEEKAIRFYPGQRKWLRIETDASSDYFNPNDPKNSKINFIVSQQLKIVGTTALRGGRLRAAFECQKDIAIGTGGNIRVELYRLGQGLLSDEAKITVVEPPKRQQKKKTNSFPDFELIKVAGPDDQNWPNISEESTEVAKYASRATLSEGTLYIYYSAAFPKFEEESRRWAGLDIHKAASFERRYEVWLAVHALLLQEQDESNDEKHDNEEVAEEFRRQERCRAAVLAAMVANQEVKAGDLRSDDAEI